MSQRRDGGHGAVGGAPRPAQPESVAPGQVTPEEVASEQTTASTHGGRPEWVDRFVWSVLWKAVVVVLTTVVLLLLVRQTQHLLGLLVISGFFALAMIPAVDHVHQRWGWRRGAAVGLIYAAAVAFVVLMVVVLVPAVVTFADQVRANGGEWVTQLNQASQDLFGKRLIGRDAADRAAVVTQDTLGGWADNLLGFAASGVGVLFDLATIALFTFYLAADYPRIQTSVLSRLTPRRQHAYGWVMEVSIQQTGGYFYSRLLLMLVNGSLSFVVMLLIGLPLAYALPMALFMGFVSEFIPAIGTYIGAAIPVLVVLAVQGIGSALILVAWVVVYQQLENLWLSPRLSAKTMELSGAIAFGAALAGGAIAGPIGAFMALPVAALITAIVKNSGRTYEVVYQNRYGGETTEGHAPS